MRHSSSEIVVLIVYVDDILLSSSDVNDIEATKKHLQQQFVTKDLGQLRYFIGFEVACNKGVVLSQRNMQLIYYKKQVYEV